MSKTNRPPGLRLHPRTMQVQCAGADLSMLLTEWQERHGLTDIEAVIEVANRFVPMLKYLLRIERHGDPNHKADEE